MAEDVLFCGLSDLTRLRDVDISLYSSAAVVEIPYNLSISLS